jgi:glycosyltransferase involved in cell wall biosynthesis
MEELQRLLAEAQHWYESGRLEKALMRYHRVVQLDPDNPGLLNDLGVVNLELGRAQSSIACFLGALKLDPSHGPAQANLAAACRAAGISVTAALQQAEGEGLEVSVVVPCHDAEEPFDRCLEALHTQTLAPSRYEVLAVANGVDAQGGQRLREAVGRWQARFGRQLKLLRIEQASIPLARNLGVQEARGKIVLQINEDTVLSRTALAEHCAEHGRFGFDPKRVVVGGRLFPEGYHRSLFNFLYESVPLYTPLHVRTTPFLATYGFVTCNLSSMRETYERFGVYDPAFEWGSDTELGKRWAKRGVQFYINTGILSYHLHWLSFDSYRANCIKRAAFTCLLGTGVLPEDLPSNLQDSVAQRVSECSLAVEEFEEEMRALESSFPGVREFNEASVLGMKVVSLQGLTYHIRPHLRRYKVALESREMLRRIMTARGAERQQAQGRAPGVAAGRRLAQPA